MKKLSNCRCKSNIFGSTQPEQRTNLKKILYLVTINYIILYFPVLANDPPSPYANVFDEGIYNQSAVKQRFKAEWQRVESRNNEEINKAILQSLFSQKIKYLEDKLFKTYDRELEDLKVLIEKYKPSRAVKTIKLVGSVLSTTTSLVLFGAMPLDGGVTTAARAARGAIAAGAAGGAAGGMLTGISEFIQPNGSIDLEKMSVALERKKRDLITQLKYEPISDLEIAYVLKKRFYTSLEITKEIEKTLLMTRLSGGLPLDFTRSFLDDCLNLPVHKKKINPNSSLWDLNDPSLGDLTTSLEQKAKQKLISYFPATKQELQKTITQITHSSLSEALSYRRFYYFWGPPGLGKSTAARAIANLLGLPCFETNIRTAEDISQRSLEGGDWQRQLANAGHIAHALLEGSRSGTDEYMEMKVPVAIASKYALPPEFVIRIPIRNATETYENSIFIINDFDRLLLDPNTSTQVLAFLLDYLDPEKKSFFSPYFRSPIKTSGLIVFITGNNEIPQEQRFEALRDRFVEVEFQAFEQDTQHQILSSFFDEMEKTYRRVNSEKRQEILTSTQDITSIRKAKKYIEGKMIEEILSNIEEDLAEENDDSISMSPLDEDETLNSDNSDQDDSNSDDPIHDHLSMHPPAFTDNEVFKKAQTLEKISESTRFLYAEKEAEQLKGVQNLLGEKYGIFPNKTGYITNLWKTRKVGRSYSETTNNLGALANRLQRFEVPQQRHMVFQFHIDLVKSVAAALLEIKDGEENFIYNKITSDPVRMDNIRYFLIHLERLSSLVNEDHCEGERLDQKSKLLLQDYKKWLGNFQNENCKIKLIEKNYNIQNRVEEIQYAELQEF